MTVSTFAMADSVPGKLLDAAKRTLDEGAAGRNPCLAYSGGKDGLVAALIAREHLGIDVGVCDTSFTFTQHRADIVQTIAKLGFKVTLVDRLDYEWLSTRPQLLFPFKSKHFNTFCQKRQRETIKRFAKSNEFDAVITGRKKHGNTVKAPVYPTPDYMSVHPLALWRDEHIWRYLNDAGVPMPWVYKTKRFGESEGNSPWTLYREFDDKQMCWQVIYDIEPAVVLESARWNLDGANQFLESINA